MKTTKIEGLPKLPGDVTGTNAFRLRLQRPDTAIAINRLLKDGGRVSFNGPSHVVVNGVSKEKMETVAKDFGLSVRASDLRTKNSEPRTSNVDVRAPRGDVSDVDRRQHGRGLDATMGNACDLVIDKLPIPVKNLKKGLSRDQHFAPGAILRLEVDVQHPLGYGLASSTYGFYINSPFFQLTEGFNSQRTSVVARYPNTNVIASGWLKGEELMAGRAAVVSIDMNPGRVVLFGLRRSIARRHTRPSRCYSTRSIFRRPVKDRRRRRISSLPLEDGDVVDLDAGLVFAGRRHGHRLAVRRDHAPHRLNNATGLLARQFRC